MSAPLQTAQRRVEGFTDTVERGARRQSAAVDRSTTQIDGSLSRQNRLFSGMTGPIGRATDGAARLFSGMRSAINRSLSGIAPDATRAGRDAGRNLADGFSRDSLGRLRDANGRFVSQARQMGQQAGQQAGGSMADGLGNGLGNGLKKAGALVATYLGAQMVGGLVAEAGRASDATDKFVSTMSFAGLDTSAIVKAKDDAKAFADQTVYDLPTIQQTMASLAANGVKNYTDITQAAGNLNAVAGGNAETFKSVSRSLSQSAGAGKLMTEDWNMLADAIPGASGQLQKAMREAGAFEGNFKKAMEGGEITAEEFQSAIIKLGNTPIASEAAKSTKTFEGALGNLEATINSGLMKALDAIKPAATAAIGALSNGLGKAMDWTGKAAQGLYDLFVKGDFTGAFREAFNVEEDNPVVDLLFDIREGAIGLYDLLMKGDYQGMLQSAFGWEEDSKAVDMLLKLRDAIIGIASGLTMDSATRDQFTGQLEGWVKAGADVRDGIEKTITTIWNLREPITVIAGLILTLLIPRFVQMGVEALKSAAQTRIAWAMTQGAAVKSAAVNVFAAWAIIGGWVLMAAAATVNAVKVAAGWLIAMGPVGWIIGLIAIVVGALVWFFTQTELGQQIVQNVWSAIQSAMQGVVDWWNGTLMPAIEAVGKFFQDAFWAIENYWNTKFIPAIQSVGQWFSDVWQGVVDWWNSTVVPWLQALAAPFVAAFDWIQRLVHNAMTIIVFLFLKLVDFWNGVLMPALQALGDYIGAIMTWIYNTLIKPHIDMWVSAFRMVVDWWNLTFIPAMQAFGAWIGQIMTWIYETLIRPVIDFIVNGFRSLVDFWNLTVVPGLQALGDFIGQIMTWIYNTLIKPYVDLIVEAFRVLTDWWNSTLMPAAQAVGDWFSVVIGGAISGVGGFIDGLVKNFESFVKFVGDKLQPVIDGIKGGFETLGQIIEGVLGKIGEFVNNPLGGIQDMLGIKKDENGQGIMPQNSGGGVYAGNGVRFSGGGVLGGYAPGRDVIPAWLSPGESVLVPELTAAIGPSNIMAANAAASGGRPAGSGPSLTSGYSGGSSRGGGATVVAEGAVQIIITTQGERVSGADIDAIRDAVNEIFNEERRRGY
jgi:tape measure domain-containing protein